MLVHLLSIIYHLIGLLNVMGFLDTLSEGSYLLSAVNLIVIALTLYQLEQLKREKGELR